MKNKKAFRFILVLAFLALIIAIVFVWPTPKPEIDSSKDPHIKNLCLYIKTMIKNPEFTQQSLQSFLSKDRPEILLQLTGYNIHFESDNNEIIVFICNQNGYLKYKDLSSTPFNVDHTYLENKIMCPFHETNGS